ncbi:MAG: aldo/keto reductase [Pseudomonadota bacterium]
MTITPDITYTSTFTFKDGQTISRLGYGAMRLTGQPGNYGPYEDWAGGKRLLRQTQALGYGHIDTARAYGPHDNERLIGEAFKGFAASERPFIASKGGIDKTGRGAAFIKADGRPQALSRHVDESLTALQRDVIDLYYLHRPDPAVPLEDSIGALLDAQQAGKIARIGVSNVTLDQLKRAQGVAQIDAVQNRYNIAEGGDEELLDYTAQQGIAFVPWGPLAAKPLVHGAPLANARSTEEGFTAPQSALRALLNRAPNILPIPGTTTITHLVENAGSIESL